MFRQVGNISKVNQLKRNVYGWFLEELWNKPDSMWIKLIVCIKTLSTGVVFYNGLIAYETVHCNI